MKKVLKRCGEWLLVLLVIVILLFAAVGFFLYLPVDYFLYKTSRFGREVRERYVAWAGLTETVKLYNGIRRAGLPIDYENGHFRYGNILILHDIGSVSYREETGEWILDEGDEANETTLTAFAEEQLAQAPACERAVFLIEKESMPDQKEFPETFLVYDVGGRESAMNILRGWIEAGAGE